MSAKSAYGFAFVSVPGHIEGPGRTIRFLFVTADIIGNATLKQLQIDAWGPVANASLAGPLNSAAAMVTGWQPFADSINNNFSRSPMSFGGAF